MKKGPVRRLRCVRYSLPTFVMVTTGIAIVGALTVNKYVQRKASVNDLQAAGGTMGVELTGPKWIRQFVTDDEYFYDPVRVCLGGITGREPNAESKGLRQLLIQLKQFRKLTALDLRKSAINDSDLAEPRDLHDLEVLRLSDTEITDAGLTSLTELTKLQSVWLSNTRVTQRGIRELQQALPICGIQY